MREEEEDLPDYTDFIKYSRDELEALKKSYTKNIDRNEGNSLVGKISRKFNIDFHSYLIKLFKILIVVVFIFFIMMGIIIALNNENNFLQKETITLVISASFFCIMIPVVIVTMLLGLDNTVGDYRKLRIINTILESKYEDEDRLITPDKPYSNKRHWIETIESCQNNIYILDKYFGETGLNILFDGLKNNTKIRSIKIITSPKKVSIDFKNNFRKFKTELKNRDIDTTLRVMCEKNLLGKIHDRYLISSDITYNIPSPDTISSGQLSSIKRVKDIIPFDTYWDKSLDLIEDWEKIKKEL